VPAAFIGVGGIWLGALALVLRRWPQNLEIGSGIAPRLD